MSLTRVQKLWDSMPTIFRDFVGVNLVASLIASPSDEDLDLLIERVLDVKQLCQRIDLNLQSLCVMMAEAVNANGVASALAVEPLEMVLRVDEYEAL